MIIQNKRTKRYFVGYVGNTPCWTNKKVEAKKYSRAQALKVIRRLECQSQRVEAISA